MNDDSLFMSSSYEERLKSIVLKEEFIPLMGEMKHSIATLITAGKGKVFYHVCIFGILKKSISN